MPIYDFRCRECSKVSEIFVRDANQMACCPDCGSDNMEKLISASYMIKMGAPAKQFGEDVLWGKLDYLIIDLPPGIADAPLTVMQSFPISGVLIVFTPQDLVEMIVRKAVNMAQKMGKSVLGVVENMSYLYVPEIDKRIELFGKSRGEEMARAAKAPLLGQLPIDPELAKLCDEGSIERYDAEIMNSLAESLSQAISAKTG